MKLAIRELRNNPLWSILGLIICFICFNTVFASLTNIGASVYQRKEFEERMQSANLSEGEKSCYRRLNFELMRSRIVYTGEQLGSLAKRAGVSVFSW